MLRASRITSIVAAVALALLMLSVGHPSQAEWWLVSPLVFAFALSPLGAAYLTAAKASYRELKVSITLFSIGYVGFATLTFYSVFRDPDAASGLSFIAVPAFGWLGLPVVALATALFIRFRRRSHQN
jgi:hypothetical protein